MSNRRKMLSVNPATVRAAASITREVVRQQQAHYANNKAGFVTGARLQEAQPKRSTSTRRTAQTQQTRSMVSSTVGVPAAVGSVVRMAPTAQKGTTIRHSELFGSVVGTSAYSVTTYQINPGLADLFPWLAKIAHSYDLYSIVRATVHYKVLTGTDTEGAIYMGYDPDALDSAPTSKTQLMSFGSSQSGPVWREISFVLPPSARGTRYVRRGSVANSTLHTYDAGIFYIATENCPVQALGDLYIDYEITLSLPHVVSADYGLYRRQYIVLAGTASDTAPLGTLPPTYLADRIVNPATVTQGTKTCTFTVQECDSYNDGGVRKWAMDVNVFTEGTGLTAATITNSDSTATGTATTNAFRADGGSGVYSKHFVFTIDPIGSVYTISWTGTTITAQRITFACAPGAMAFSSSG